MRLLLVSHQMPFPADNGAKLRTLNLARQLARRSPLLLLCPSGPPGAERELGAWLGPSAEVVTAPPPQDRGVAGLLSPLPRDVLLAEPDAPFARALAEQVRRWRPDVLIAADPSLGEHLRPYPQLTRVVDVAQEYALYMRRAMRRAPPSARLLWRLRLAKWSAYTTRLAPRVDLWLVPAEADRVALSAQLPLGARVAIVPNGVDVAHNAFTPDPNAPPQVVYSGALSFEPNRDAASYLCREIWPLVRRSVPAAHLLITGASEAAPPEVRAAPSTTLTGHVPDVRPVLARCRAAVVPLRLGAGTRLKILEALAVGTPVVATTLGAEGLAARDGEHLLLADTPETFSECVVAALESAELRSRLAWAGRCLVERHYSWDVIGLGLLTALDDLAARRTADRPAGPRQIHSVERGSR